MVEVRIQIKGAAELAAAFRRAPAIASVEFQTAIEKIIRQIQNDAMKEAPVNKQSGGGNLRQSIKAYMQSKGIGIIEVLAEYGLYVHEGTRPHTITVVKSRVLANVRTGQIFGRTVKHPGTRANPFMQRAVDKNRGYVESVFNQALANVFRKIA